MTSEFLNAGLTLQFETHRDTWFSAPFCQVNWWMPVYDVVETNVMAFHPRYFSQGARNSSRDYDYFEWVETGARPPPRRSTWRPASSRSWRRRSRCSPTSG